MERVTTIAIDHADAPALAARAIDAGGVIAFATDTVYGLGAAIRRPDAIARLYALKGRPDEKALPVLLASAAQWADLASDASAAARRLMDSFWPGALTIVLPRRPEVPDAVGPLTSTIALRVPAHAALRRVLAHTGPLASSSANRSGQPPFMDVEQTRAGLGPGLALVLDGGHLPARPPSTVVEVAVAGPGERPRPLILRQGAITAEEIARALAPLGQYNES